MLRRLLAAAACLAALAGVAGCKGTAPSGAAPAVPPSFWPCPSGQHFGMLRDGEWGCQK